MRQRQPRVHDGAHRRFIQSLPCIICGDNTATEAAHVRYAEPKAAKPITGMQTKPDDDFIVPLCSQCHRVQHNEGNERMYWARRRIDPVYVSLALAKRTGDYTAGLTIINAYRANE